jgi:hypothetical protein
MFRTAVLLLAALPAFASVVGTVTLSSCAGGGVTVSNGTIDFFAPTEPGLPHNGCATTGGLTDLSFAGGTILPGQAATINDLGLDPAAVANAGFISFVSAPSLAFNLTLLGPGNPSTACPTSLSPSGVSCSVLAGSPFILTTTPTGTTVTLPASGTVSDAVSSNSTFIGSFTTQIIDVTPASIQASVQAGNSVTSTFSFAADVTPGVPEPASLVLIGIGLAAISLRKLRVR